MRTVCILRLFEQNKTEKILLFFFVVMNPFSIHETRSSSTSRILYLVKQQYLGIDRQTLAHALVSSTYMYTREEKKKPNQVLYIYIYVSIYVCVSTATKRK